MNFKRNFSIFILSLGLSVTVSSCGSCNKINKVSSGKNTATVETEVETESPKPDISVSAESDDPLLFMETLTGYKSIVQVNGVIDIEKIKEMLEVVDSGETDSIGRRYFAYSVPHLRQAQVSMTERRFDIESRMANAAGELKRDVADIVLIARRVDKVITYVVKIDDDNYGYGVFYIISAIPIESQISPDNVGLLPSPLRQGCLVNPLSAFD